MIVIATIAARITIAATITLRHEHSRTYERGNRGENEIERRVKTVERERQ